MTQTAHAAGYEALKGPWDALIAVDDVAAEVADLGRELTPEAVAVRELERGFPFAVKRLVSIAMHSGDDRIARLAANDVINHNFALKAAQSEKGDKDNLAELIKGVTADEMTEMRKQVESSRALQGDKLYQEYGEPLEQ